MIYIQGKHDLYMICAITWRWRRSEGKGGGGAGVMRECEIMQCLLVYRLRPYPTWQENRSCLSDPMWDMRQSINWQTMELGTGPTDERTDEEMCAHCHPPITLYSVFHNFFLIPHSQCPFHQLTTYLDSRLSTLHVITHFLIIPSLGPPISYLPVLSISTL